MENRARSIAANRIAIRTDLLLAGGAAAALLIIAGMAFAAEPLVSGEIRSASTAIFAAAGLICLFLLTRNLLATREHNREIGDTLLERDAHPSEIVVGGVGHRIGAGRGRSAQCGGGRR